MLALNAKSRTRTRRGGTLVAVLCLALGASVAIATTAFGKGGGDSGGGPVAQADQTISSVGPLTKIYLNDQLNCQVDHVADTSHEFFGDVPGACATLIATGGTLYGPSDIPAGGSASPRTTYTPVSQTPVTGSGTSADPLKVVTVVDAGASGLRLTQTDSYVIGTESYRSDVTVSNTTDALINFILYRAGDCFLQDSDNGFGELNLATGEVTCRGSDDGITPNSRIERWVPLTGGSSAFENGFSTVWAAIGSQTLFNNTCICSTYTDNGAGLSWGGSVGGFASATYSHLTIFSPLGQITPFITKTAALEEVDAGGDDSYTVRVTNPLGADITLTSITDHLPGGFSYRGGTTTGGITSEPTVSGQDVTWSGSFNVPAGGTLEFSFGVTVSSVGGVYFNSVDAVGSAAVEGTGDTAPITVAELVVTELVVTLTG